MPSHEPIILHLEQGSPEWIEARLAIPTSSAFSRILTPTGRISQSREKYMGELLSEWVFGEPFEEFRGTYWTDRGKELEGDAQSYYEMVTDLVPDPVGFIYADHRRRVGSSPDALVGDDGLLELKCPMPSTHLVWLSVGMLPKQHWWQVQGQIWVARRKWCDFMSYCPGLPPLLLRIRADTGAQRALSKHLPVFNQEMDVKRAELMLQGVVPQIERAA